MTTTLFVNTDTLAIVDYSTMKLHEDFDEMSVQWPLSPTAPSVDDIITMHSAPFARFYETNAPSIELWETSEHSTTPIYNNVLERWERQWDIRNMTQTELDDFNAARLQQNSDDRAYRYREESDPLFFKSYREETTMQEWIDKVNQIRTELPKPEIVTIPE